MKKRYAGGIGVVLVLGFLLGQFWKLPGLGSGSDLETETTTTDEEETELTEEEIRDVSVNNNVRSMTGPAGHQPVDENPFVTIAIDANRYRLTTPDAPKTGAEISLGEVVDRVTKADGGNAGIRLRVLFHKNAQEGALADLHAALVSAGVKREEIQEIAGFVD